MPDKPGEHSSQLCSGAAPHGYRSREVFQVLIHELERFLEATLPVGNLLIAAALLYGAWHSSGLHEITADEAEGINTLILLIGSIYAVIFAFVIYVIWGQFTDVENFMMRECKIAE